jgi:hypothetical protein
MKFIINIVKKLIPKDIPKPVGRWRVEHCNIQMNNKIDLSNEDHCGPCGQYALEKNLQQLSGKLVSDMMPIESIKTPK